MEPQLETLLRETHRIGRRLVYAVDPERPGILAGLPGCESNHVADAKGPALHQLARDDDAGQRVGRLRVAARSGKQRQDD